MNNQQADSPEYIHSAVVERMVIIWQKQMKGAVQNTVSSAVDSRGSENREKEK